MAFFFSFSSIRCSGIEKKTHLVFNRGVEEHCGLKPLVRVVAALNPFNCFIDACVQVNNQTTHRTSIHVIHKRHAIFTLNFRAQKPHVITLFALTCFHVCKLSILIPYNKTKYTVKPGALALIRSCDLSARAFTICSQKDENPNGAKQQRFRQYGISKTNSSFLNSATANLVRSLRQSIFLVFSVRSSGVRFVALHFSKRCSARMRKP